MLFQGEKLFGGFLAALLLLTVPVSGAEEAVKKAPEDIAKATEKAPAPEIKTADTGKTAEKAPAPAPKRLLPWTPADLEDYLAGPDPLEGFNRVCFAGNDLFMVHVADILGRVYTTIFPRPFVDRFDKVCVNLEYPARCVSCLLRGEWRGAGDETVRFLANTTLGLARLFDVAEEWWGIYSTESDFGQAFAAWGIGPGCSLMVPACASTNVRDVVGALFDTAFDLKTYIPYAGSASALNRIVVKHREYIPLVRDSNDHYQTFREVMIFYRELRQQLWKYRMQNAGYQMRKALASLKKKIRPQVEPATEEPEDLRGRYIPIRDFSAESPEVDSMRLLLFRPQHDDDPLYMRLSYFNRDFSSRCDERKLELMPGREPLRCGFWKHPVKEKPLAGRKLVMILPGIGGSYFGSNQTALAELFYDAGFDVLSFHSTFNWQFIQSDSPCRLPGYLPDDADRMRNALRAGLMDLACSGEIETPDLYLVGYSMGGMQLLKIAELEEKNPLLGIRRYVAINPPVSLERGLKTIDAMLAKSAGWDAPQLVAELLTAGQTLLAFQRTLPPYDPQHPETADQYRVSIRPRIGAILAGIALKISLRGLLLEAHRENGIPGLPEYRWGRRTPLYRAMDAIRLEDYAAKVLVPTYPGRTKEELLQKCDLHAFKDFLARSPKVRVLHNCNDFLLSQEDRDFLDETLREKIYWFSNGGHLGNFCTVPFQQTLKQALTE